jgi:hypothetical protein
MVIVVITGGVTIIHHQSIATAKKKRFPVWTPRGTRTDYNSYNLSFRNNIHDRLLLGYKARTEYWTINPSSDELSFLYRQGKSSRSNGGVHLHPHQTYL